MYQVLPQFISSLLEYFTLWPSSSWLWSPPSSCSAQLVAWRRDNSTDRAYSAFHHRIPSLQWLVKAQAGNIIFVTITVITINLLHHLQRHHQQRKSSTIKTDTTSAKCLQQQNVCNSKMFRPRCFLASSTPALNFFSRWLFSSAWWFENDFLLLFYLSPGYTSVQALEWVWWRHHRIWHNEKSTV